MAKTIYRKTAIDRLSSPEQLDRLVPLTHTNSWLALTMLLAMIVIACVWSVLGSLPSRVSGEGILLAGGGRVFNAVAPYDGMLEEITVTVGDAVEAEQVVARLSQRNLEIEFKTATASMKEFRTELDRVTAAVAGEQELRVAAIERQIASAQTRIARVGERLAEGLQRFKIEQDLLNRGLSTNARFTERQTRVDQIVNELSDLRQRLADVEVSRFDNSSSGIEQIENARRQFADAERRVSTIQARLTREAVIRAPGAGRVTEVQAAPGEVIAIGRPIVSFESFGEGLELALYLPPQYGKSVKTGMNVQISPTTAKQEEYGTIVGTIRSVSHFPSTVDGMMAVVRNMELVRQFSSAGPPYRAIVVLEKDAQSTSGYRWTSDRGKELDLHSGTLAKAEVTVRSQRPIEMVIPLLRGWTGL